MPTYTCPRCGFYTDHRSNMCYHINKRYPCQPTVSDIPIEQLAAQYNKPKIGKYNCLHCGKNYLSKAGFSKHNCIQTDIVDQTQQPSTSDLLDEDDTKIVPTIFNKKIKNLETIITDLQQKIINLENKNTPITIYLKAHPSVPALVLESTHEEMCSIDA